MDRPDKVVCKAAMMRWAHYAILGAKPLSWAQLTDAQKLPWLLKAAAGTRSYRRRGNMPDVTTDGRCEVIETGQPPAQLLACTRCGVLLWDVDKHYRDAHGIACVVDDCPIGPFSSIAELNAHSREHHLQERRIVNIANSDLIVRRYPGANQVGDFTWFVLD